MTARAAPDLSVVVPSVNGWVDLEGCLQALDSCGGGCVLEIVVADRVGEEVRRHIRDRPGVRLVEAPPGTTIPELRAMSFSVATADVVAVIEDHVQVPPGWAEAMLAAHAEGARVVGGAVKNTAVSHLRDVAAFLCEYSHCLAPPAGPSDWLVGNNVTYSKSLLKEFDDVVNRHGWENLLHDAIRASGVELLSRPDIVVAHKKHYRMFEYIHQRYLYSRSYAGVRLRDSRFAKRAFYGAATLALPPLLLLRITSRVWSSGGNRRELIQSLPLLGVFTVAWAVGEMVGYVFGAGDSLERVC